MTCAEGCLIYVAATRAREDLWVGWSAPPAASSGSRTELKARTVASALTAA